MLCYSIPPTVEKEMVHVSIVIMPFAQWHILNFCELKHHIWFTYISLYMQCWYISFISILWHIFGLNSELFFGVYFLSFTCPFCDTICSFKIYNLLNIIDYVFNEAILLYIFLNLISISFFNIFTSVTIWAT